MRTDNAADIRLNAMLGNCIFYISPMYEFSHSLDPERTFDVEGADQQDGPQRRTRHRADDAAELTRESRHTFLFKANHKRATASEGVEYKSSYPSYPDAVHRHFPQSKIREKNFSPHAAMSSERVGRNQSSADASSPSE